MHNAPLATDPLHNPKSLGAATALMAAIMMWPTLGGCGPLRTSSVADGATPQVSTVGGQEAGTAGTTASMQHADGAPAADATGDGGLATASSDGGDAGGGAVEVDGGAGDAGSGVFDAGSGAGDAGTIAPADAGGSMQDGDTPADFTRYQDPGKGAWETGTAEYCKLDVSKFKDTSIDTYAVIRYGKLCHIKGKDVATEMFSATKTLGGVMTGRAAYLTRDIKRSGRGTGPILHTDTGTDWIASPTYARRDATMSHVMAMVSNASPSLKDSELVFSYDGLGFDAVNGVVSATEKCIAQIPGLPTNAADFVRKEIFERMGMSSSTWSPALFGIAMGWSANLSDMAKLGTLLLHDGWYGGERLLSQEWVYRMSHPAFETANTAYGQLAWVNHRGNAVGVNGDVRLGPSGAEGDPCAPAALWPKYPHPPSGAKDCRAPSCSQRYDVGVFSAYGANTNYIIMHPGLDLVIVAINYNAQVGQRELWDAVRPGVVARDPTYQGDEASFCKDYGAGNYAPDLVVSRFKPVY